MINALQGGGGEPDPCELDPNRPECQNFQFTCDAPIRIENPEFGAEMGIDTCGQQPSEAPDECGNPVGFDAVFEIRVRDAGDYTICPDAPPDSSFAYTTDCVSPGAEVCLAPDACSFLFLSTGSHFLRWRSGSLDSCGFVSVFIERADSQPETGVLCLDGGDNDSTGVSDCEEDSCKFEGLCESGLTPEACNGVDDGDVFSAGFKLIDEAACHCVSDEGCDHIDLDSPIPYVCHDLFAANGDGFGTCGPVCDSTFDWCEQIGAVCKDGRCSF